MDFVGNSDTCDKSGFEFPLFLGLDSIITIGDANIINNYARLTRSSTNRVGALWFKNFVPLKNGFSTEFSFKFTEGYNQVEDGSLPGADGIAFVIHNSGTSSIGLMGGGLGYDMIANSLAIEFDMFVNDSNQLENLGDSNGNHIAIMCNGKNRNSSNHLSSSNLALTTQIPLVRSDGTQYFARIEYKQVEKNLNVYLDTSGSFQAPVLTLKNIEIDKLLDLYKDEWAYVGFTGATGIAFQNQDIIKWKFCPAKTNSILSGVERIK